MSVRRLWFPIALAIVWVLMAAMVMADFASFDEATRTLVAPLVERAGLVAAFDDAWLLIGGLVAFSLLFLLLRSPSRT